MMVLKGALENSGVYNDSLLCWSQAYEAKVLIPSTRWGREQEAGKGSKVEACSEPGELLPLYP